MYPNGSFEICPVCYWESDNVQNTDPAYEGGANQISLLQAKANFVKFGAVHEKFSKYVRDPLPEEIPDNGSLPRPKE